MAAAGADEAGAGDDGAGPEHPERTAAAARPAAGSRYLKTTGPRRGTEQNRERWEMLANTAAFHAVYADES